MTVPPSPTRRPTIRAIRMRGYQYTPPAGKSYGNSRAMGFAPRSSIIEVETDEGVIGVGEAAGAPGVVREYLKTLSPNFIGRSIFDFDAIAAWLYNKLYHSGVQNAITGTLAGINVALFDAIGKTFGVRVCDLIGGCVTTRLPVYASTGYFSDDPDNTYEDMIRKVAGMGFLGAKIKIGRGVKSDVERTALARDLLGPDALVIVDMNGSYTPDVALESINAMTPYGLHWVEEPIPPTDLRGYAELRLRVSAPLAAVVPAIWAPAVSALLAAPATAFAP